MVPFIVLIAATALARLVGLTVPYADSWPAATAIGLAAAFALASTAHFRQPRREGLIAIVPPAIPRPDLAVTATGLIEVVGPVGLLIEPLRTPAAVGLALLLVAVFPANVRAADARRHPAAPTTPLPRRAAVQLGFLAACAVAAGAGRLLT